MRKIVHSDTCSAIEGANMRRMITAGPAAGAQVPKERNLYVARVACAELDTPATPLRCAWAGVLARQPVGAGAPLPMQPVGFK